MAAKIRFRGNPVCRAQGNSKIYESSHRGHLTKLRENHKKYVEQEQHIAALVAVKQAKKQYVMVIFNKEIITDSKEMYDAWLRQRTCK